jgi:hypothetical protein
LRRENDWRSSTVWSRSQISGDADSEDPGCGECDNR